MHMWPDIKEIQSAIEHAFPPYCWTAGAPSSCPPDRCSCPAHAPSVSCSSAGSSVPVVLQVVVLPELLKLLRPVCLCGVKRLHDLLGLGQQPVLAAAQAASVLLTQREEEKSGGGGESVHEAEVVHDVAVLLVNLQGRQESVQLVAIVAIVVVDPVNR